MSLFNDKLYNTRFHLENLSKHSFLITGGAGFIGSNLVEYLLKYGAGHVRVLDNFSNGYMENIKDFLALPNFKLIEGDIRDIDTCKLAVEGVDFISHQAALGSVPRSINDPITTNEVNVGGFLNMMVAANESLSLKRFVYAASSSTYGDSPALPKVEGYEGNLLSPYAVSKLMNEVYADVFTKVYNFHSIGLRYFNIFGPKQNPNNPYAAVIPIFCENVINEIPLVINGDGNTSRDFTFVENAVQANIKAFFNKDITKHDVYNVACGDEISLNDLVEFLQDLSGKDLSVIYRQERMGDVKHSRASIEKIAGDLNYYPLINFRDGLSIVFEWYKKSKGTPSI